MKITIGPTVFPTKSAAEAHCRAILWSYKPGENIVRRDHELFLRDLIELHPEADEKIGCGISCFHVQADGFGGQCFWITRLDGTPIHFSFKNCISGAKNPWANLASGCRTAIVDQKMFFRDAAFGGQSQARCALTGDMVTREESHVDHVVPFNTLVMDWLTAEGLIENALWKTIDLVSDGTFTRIDDDNVLASWCEYHRTHAKLRIVGAQAHLQLPRVGQRPGPR